ncbi:DUF3710 domain-containing protein [Tomitella fengzijianii]|uniref:DUF3710 domain-containing protein n=1 Tax=Tomitella fengzijianii TaxID=2597660 RepID=A0A516X3F4_9ACTN|nr:DUF3710 domain-containing protein [Tomitella fengzijianii]QDQ97600.1 DUF3710 domain-containing protein [Tomitella fengzijianii]
MFGRNKRNEAQAADDGQPGQSPAERQETGAEPDAAPAQAGAVDAADAEAAVDAADAEAVVDSADAAEAAPGGSDDDAPEAQDRSDGPFDEAEVEGLEELAAEARVLDLGSVLIPVPEGGQVQVEMAPNGSVNGVFVTVGGGRVTMAAFAAPKSPGQWRSVITELAESVRGDGATASVRTGPWGRELHASSANGDVRFIGVDGPRWMLRGVAIGPSGSVGDDAELTGVAREMISGAVVRRGTDPMPVRSPLTVTLPQELAQQLAQAQQQRAAQTQAEQQRAAAEQLQQRQQQMTDALREASGGAQGAGGADGDGASQAPRQNPNGSAMQQFRRGGGA